jgi:hypothetical protein
VTPEPNKPLLLQLISLHQNRSKGPASSTSNAPAPTNVPNSLQSNLDRQKREEEEKARIEKQKREDEERAKKAAADKKAEDEKKKKLEMEKKAAEQARLKKEEEDKKKGEEKKSSLSSLAGLPPPGMRLGSLLKDDKKDAAVDKPKTKEEPKREEKPAEVKKEEPKKEEPKKEELKKELPPPTTSSFRPPLGKLQPLGPPGKPPVKVPPNLSDSMDSLDEDEDDQKLKKIDERIKKVQQESKLANDDEEEEEEIDYEEDFDVASGSENSPVTNFAVGFQISHSNFFFFSIFCSPNPALRERKLMIAVLRQLISQASKWRICSHRWLRENKRKKKIGL